MKLPCLITTDLHLTANPRDEYRWSLFPWLAKECKLAKVKTLLILGDLTDAKDYHPADLVNRITDCLDRCSEFVEEIVILTGNHDYLKEGSAFFAFLNHHPKIRFITKPTESSVRGKPDEVVSLFLPHSKNPEVDWADLSFRKYDLIFMHQTVQGSIVSNGQAMASSLGSTFGLKGAQRIYSGDIHVPQVIGDVIYVGSPYPVHFGDTFKARCVLITADGLSKDLHFYTVQRVTVDIQCLADLKQEPLYEGDQVKVRVHLGEADRLQWSEIRAEIVEYLKKKKVDVVSIELKAVKAKRTTLRTATSTRRLPAQNVEQYVREMDLGGDLLDAGLEILETSGAGR